ncbi:FAD/NAD(P)-binding protein [Natrarchaeobius sp. A-rgal3]|uniref:FAD/NAD(P)-binding protein n=1 Tax=Natrarchaeobius versutus TaxID=1679078 RepID=UPI003510CD6D
MDRDETTVTVVGGGVHGVHLAIRLLEAELLEADRLRIVEPDGLLGGFRRKCAQCGTDELRSPYVHHVSPDPFSLRNFARRRGRVDELVPSDVGSDRPTVSLFFDHAAWVCERYDLESTVVRAAATDIEAVGDHLVVETTAGPLSTEWCVLAVGHGRSYAVPEWAETLPPEAPVCHVWDPAFDPDAVGETESVGIVGGGITAAQLAPTLAQPGREPTMFARSPFRVESLEAGTDWMHFGGVVDELHGLPSASRERARAVVEARYDGAMPPHVFARLRRALERDRLSLERTEIEVATEAGGTVVVTCRDGTARCLDRLVCATGFDSPYDGSLLRRIRAESRLATGYRGAPVLDDETLRWRRRDGSPSRLFVTGVAAQQVLGPFARNVIGARRAGDLVVAALGSALERDRSPKPR